MTLRLPTWLGAPRSRWLLAPAAGLAAAALLPAEGLAATALRSLAVVAALGLLAATARRPAAGERSLSLRDRQPLGRECGVALVEAAGRTLLVGYAPSGVAVLADLSPGERP